MYGEYSHSIRQYIAPDIENVFISIGKGIELARKHGELHFI